VCADNRHFTNSIAFDATALDLIEVCTDHKSAEICDPCRLTCFQSHLPTMSRTVRSIWLVHCKFGSLLHSAFAEQNDGDRLKKNLQVQPEREVVDVVQVELHAGMKISDATTSVDLP